MQVSMSSSPSCLSRSWSWFSGWRTVSSRTSASIGGSWRSRGWPFLFRWSDCRDRDRGTDEGIERQDEKKRQTEETHQSVLWPGQRLQDLVHDAVGQKRRHAELHFTEKKNIVYWIYWLLIVSVFLLLYSVFKILWTIYRSLSDLSISCNTSPGTTGGNQASLLSRIISIVHKIKPKIYTKKQVLNHTTSLSFYIFLLNIKNLFKPVVRYLFMHIVIFLKSKICNIICL